jgi:hypothetical protein
MTRAVLLLLAGCGTTTFLPSGDASTDAAPDAADDSGDPCPMMKVQIDQTKQKLQQCTNPGSGGQCQNLVSDGCCPFSTNADNTTMFQALVSQYRNMCKPVCLGTCLMPLKMCAPDLTCR